MSTTGLAVVQRRHRFNDSEDIALTRLVGQWGTNSWAKIAAGIPGLTDRQCRERWKHYLSGHRDVPWTPEDDDFIWDKVAKIGPRWTQIGTMLNTRTDAEVRARWKYLYRKRHCASFRLACGDSQHQNPLPVRRQRAQEQNADCTVGAAQLSLFEVDWHLEANRNDVRDEDDTFAWDFFQSQF
jgi:hypothetical protein